MQTFSGMIGRIAKLFHFLANICYRVRNSERQQLANLLTAPTYKSASQSSLSLKGTEHRKRFCLSKMDILNITNERPSDVCTSVPIEDVRLSLFKMICGDSEYVGKCNQFGQRDVRLSRFKMICGDGEYAGEWNQFGQREGRGIMKYLDSSSRG